MSHQTGPPGRKETVRRHKLFLELLPESRTAGEAYIAAGYRAKTPIIAHQNACRLIRQLDAKLDYRAIMDSEGLTDRYVSRKIKEVVDHKDKHVSVKGLNLTTRCKGWQQPNISVGVGVQIVLSPQLSQQEESKGQPLGNQVIDVTPDDNDIERIED